MTIIPIKNGKHKIKENVGKPSKSNVSKSNKHRLHDHMQLCVASSPTQRPTKQLAAYRPGLQSYPYVPARQN